MSIKRQILLRFGAILAVCLVIAAVSVSAIFIRQARGQAAAENEARLRQTALQMDYIIKDLRAFASNMAIDQLLQSAMFGELYQKYSSGGVAYLAGSRMKDYKTQRDDIQSITLVTAHGQVIWEERINDGYFETLMQEAWYQDVKGTGVPVCSVPHTVLSNNGTPHQVISYVVPVYNVNRPQNDRAYLILNVFLHRFTSQLDLIAPQFDRMAWRQSGALLLQTGGARARRAFRACASFGDTCLEAQYALPLVELITLPALVLQLLIILGLLVLGLAVMVPVARHITEPLQALTDLMINTACDGRWLEGPALPAAPGRHVAQEIGILQQVFHRMITELRGQMKKHVEYEGKMQRLRTELILSQLKPHFLYNTLHTVQILAKKYGAGDIEEITQSLIALLQKSLTFESQEAFYPLEEELQGIRQYATIQKYRYKDKFALCIDVPQALLHCPVPRFILQPVVENSIFHGIAPKEENGEIWVRARRAGGQLVLCVDDDGVGMEELRVLSLLEEAEPEEAASLHKSIGLQNVRSRLRTIYGAGAALEINSQPGQGCCVTLRLPLEGL